MGRPLAPLPHCSYGPRTAHGAPGGTCSHVQLACSWATSGTPGTGEKQILEEGASFPTWSRFQWRAGVGGLVFALHCRDIPAAAQLWGCRKDLPAAPSLGLLGEAEGILMWRWALSQAWKSS